MSYSQYYHRVVAATPIKTTAVSMSQYSMEVDEQLEDLPEDEGMDDLDLGLEEALQGTFTSQPIAVSDERSDEGTTSDYYVFVSCSVSVTTELAVEQADVDIDQGDDQNDQGL